MPRETVKVTIGGELVDVTLRSANIEDASYHTQLLMAGDAIQLDGTHKTASRKNVGTYLYPHCVACVEGPESVREMPLDEFMQLDELEINSWAAASARLCRHWWQAQSDYIKAAMAEISGMSAEAQKKTGTRSNGSRKSTTTRTQTMTRSRPSPN